MDVWRQVFKNCLGASVCSRCSELYADITCVLLGVKPALLVDHTTPDAVKLQQALRELHHVGQLSASRDAASTLHLVKAGMDVLVVNAPLVNQLIKAEPQNNTPVIYVDISTTLPTPQLATKSTSAAVNTSISAWFTSLRQRHSSPSSLADAFPILSSSSSSREAEEEEEEGCRLNLCTVFGRLLGYPVVYWFDPMAGYSLEMVELVQHSVTVSHSEGAAHTATLEHLKQDHCLYSFSVPQAILELPEVGVAVGAWFEAVRSSAGAQGLAATLTTRTVCLPSVML